MSNQNLGILFEHNGIMEPRPWPVWVTPENVVTSGLGDSDGALLVGFGSQGAQRVDVFVDEARKNPMSVIGLAPTFVKNGTMFEWSLPVAQIAVEVIEEDEV